MLVIEKAKPEDAERICEIRDTAWLEVYPNGELGITREDVELMAKGPEDRFLKNRIAYLQKALASGETKIFVAKLDGLVIGYIDPYEENGRRSIGSIYVAPGYQGQGIGGQLLQKVLDMYGREKDIFLEVVTYNQNAISFYEKFGFRKTDAVVPAEEGRPGYLKTLPEIEMVLPAQEPAK